MASNLTGLSLAWIIIHHLPFTLLALIGGWIVIKPKPLSKANIKTESMPLKTLLRLFVPILIPVLSYSLTNRFGWELQWELSFASFFTV